MRILLLLATLLATTAWTGGGRRTRPDDLDQHALTAEQLQRYTTPYLHAIRACYATHAARVGTATGKLALHLVIAGDGRVKLAKLEAPGVAGRTLAQLTACVRRDVAAWHFPVRAGVTYAIVPFHYHRADAPGAGPLPSCYDPRGCREHGRR